MSEMRISGIVCVQNMATLVGDGRERSIPIRTIDYHSFRLVKHLLFVSI